MTAPTAGEPASTAAGVPSGGPAESGPGDSTFIRAGGGVQANPRLIAAVTIWFVVAVLGAMAVYFWVTGARQGSDLSALWQRGVPVEVTVTSCRGVSSGIGMGTEYWECRGSYTLGSATSDALINGSRKFIENGAVVQAIAVPGRPDLLSTVQSVRSGKGSAGQYPAAIGLTAACLVTAAAGVAFKRRGRRVSPPEAARPPGDSP